MSRFKQGSFVPKHKQKYAGPIEKIFYRSSYELKFMKWCDENPNVTKWNSECVVIPYKKPTDQKIHRYFMDFLVEYRNKDGKIVKEIIEIKPYSQTLPPKKKRGGKSNLYETVSYAINIAKWEAATKWAKKRGIQFRILTEKDLFR